MRQFTFLAAIAAVCVTAATATVPAEAGHERYGYGDRYAYRYEPRGYYPYYNSRYWKPAHVMRQRKRARYVHPPYYRAWGSPDAGYHHRAWHAYHHGRIHIGHW